MHSALHPLYELRSLMDPTLAVAIVQLTDLLIVCPNKALATKLGYLGRAASLPPCLRCQQRILRCHRCYRRSVQDRYLSIYSFVHHLPIDKAQAVALALCPLSIALRRCLSSGVGRRSEEKVPAFCMLSLTLTTLKPTTPAIESGCNPLDPSSNQQGPPEVTSCRNMAALLAFVEEHR